MTIHRSRLAVASGALAAGLVTATGARAQDSVPCTCADRAMRMHWPPAVEGKSW